MGKKSANKFGPQQVPAAAAVSRPSLEKQLHTWEASFESASKVYQSFDMSMSIHVEQDWLLSVLERFQAEGDTDLARWIERFADFCKELVKLKERLHEEYAERWDQANNLVAGIGSREQALAEQQDAFATAKAAFDQAKAAFEDEQAQLALKKSELLDAERSLNLREANAQAGFVEQNEQALRQLEERQQQLIKQQESSLRELQDEKRKLDAELAQAARRLAEIKYNCSEEESERIKQLDDREHEIKQSKMELDRARSRMDREWADIKAMQANLEQRVAAEMEAERASHERAIAKLESQRDSAWNKADELKEKLADLQELAQALGDQSAADILGQLDELKRENAMLKRSLEQSDTSELQREIDYLRSSKADLERDLAVIRPELDESRRELSSKRVASTELEAVAREKRVLEQHKNTLTVHIDDLESRIEQLTSAQKTQTPFPAMSLMDSGKEYRASMEHESVPGLKQFAEELQHRIATAEEQVELFYPLEDIRLLLGGLAMSQLHVFQGISGTGKTSLAKAFAKAMGGFCTDIAVQAGWRDRDDLLGHYNAFERRFYEKDCLQALYKAQTPRWRDTCNVILLDEMNLSRPEQYFAEFLSALEKNNRDERLISLAETAMPNAPVMLRDGRKILVPSNVWFIGTANHDETTNELADKTYDRAHVMTLPKQDHRFTIKQYDPASFSYASLNKAFDEACNKHRQEVGDLLKWLSEDDLTKQLETDFGLGWGNR
ncbi:AAA family ATPase, partial [Pseudomonas aeruginosa]|nr:AAA family ATPase [Pseudomonas aeruginosa]EKW1536030.1 AAA family ATPase [Pseudomonas aeruginosa]ELQ7978690.1 AAA family ATPase [Pseudomonas aeruginosa]ELV3002778.1 AAA family ATPase [Pseudomonas aeruginosa]